MECFAGKSLTVHQVARQAWQWAKSQGVTPPQIVSINCMSLKQPSNIFMRALSGFHTSEAEQPDEPLTFAGELLQHLSHSHTRLL